MTIGKPGLSCRYLLTIATMGVLTMGPPGVVNLFSAPVAEATLLATGGY